MSFWCRLQTEYRECPRNIEVRYPTFCWQGPSATLRLRQGGRCLWSSSGEVHSPAVYDGPPLSPATRYEWTLEQEDESAGSWFETGLDEETWAAEWISDPEHDGRPLGAVSCFRHGFRVRAGMTRGRLYVTALGVFHASFDGKAVSDEVLMPGWSDFFTRTRYCVYPLEAELAPGEHEISVLLGDGWFCGTITAPGYGTTPALKAQLVLEYEDGTREIVGSSADWEVSHSGPWRMSDIYMGETFDAAREWENWHSPRIASYGGTVEAFDGAPIRRIETRLPVARQRLPDGKWIVDFGQNLTGRERIGFHSLPGKTVTIRHGEALNADGSLYTANLRAAKATTTLIGNGAMLEYEPLFTFYGFRYLELEGVDEFEIDAHVIHSEMALTSEFHCSNELLNQLMRNIVWGQRDNFLDVPTDCPQRDERRGWLGDVQVFMPTALYQMDCAAFFRKWLVDVESCRDAEGAYPPYAPFHVRGQTRQYGQSGWADAGILCPYQLYLHYGDRRILERHYDAMRRFAEYQTERADGGILKRALFRDWLNLGAETPEELISTAFYGHDLRLMNRIAQVLGRGDDAEMFAGLRSEVERAVASRFFTGTGDLTARTQTAAALLLGFELVPEEFRAATAAFLNEDVIVNRGTHLSTGFLGTPHLLHALSENGYLDTAYRLLEQTTYPSWLYPVTQGATTVWERWNSWTAEDGFGNPAMNSFNHYAYGAVADWVFGVAAGIQPDWESPGFRRFRFAPRPGGSLDFLEMRHDSPAGTIRAGWRKRNGTFRFELSVPPGAFASVTLPGGSACQQVGEGGYCWTVPKYQNEEMYDE